MSTVTYQAQKGADVEVKIGCMEYTPVQVVCEGPNYAEEEITVRLAPVFFARATQGLAVWADPDKHALYVGPEGELFFVKTPDMNPSILVTGGHGVSPIVLRRLDVGTLSEYNRSATLA